MGHYMEMVSHGYIIFAIDHKDGSNGYTENKDGTAVKFDTSIPFFDYEGRNS